MGTTKLILKHPSGWFAAGPEVARAMVELSDGAFKLYMKICTEADRHTGRARVEPNVLARMLRKTPALMEADLAEMVRSGVCDRCGNEIEIRDCFWPYEKQALVLAGAPNLEFVRQAREAFLERACVNSTFTAADQKLALQLCQNGVSIDQLRWAIWLGCARKYMAMLNGRESLPIGSLAYFAKLIDEVSGANNSAAYFEYVQGKMQKWEKLWLESRDPS